MAQRRRRQRYFDASDYTKNQRLAVAVVGTMLLISPLAMAGERDLLASCCTPFASLPLMLAMFWAAPRILFGWACLVDRVRGFSEAFIKWRDQASERRTIKRVTGQQDRELRAANNSQAKQEVVMRLGTVDQFVRIYAAETDPSRRLIAVQTAQAEITTWNMKVVAGEIDVEVLRDPRVLECVRETLADLTSSGLGADRISRDIRRIFGLPETAGNKLSQSRTRS